MRTGDVSAAYYPIDQRFYKIDQKSRDTKATKRLTFQRRHGSKESVHLTVPFTGEGTAASTSHWASQLRFYFTKSARTVFFLTFLFCFLGVGLLFAREGVSPEPTHA